MIAGAARLTELTGGAAITPQNARFFASPVPVVIHIVSVTIYSLLGAFQFVPALRGRRGWHRVAGSYPHSRRPARRALRPVDVGVLPAPGRHHRRPDPAVLRLGNARQHHSRDRRDPAPGFRAARRVDDARLCHRRRPREPRPWSSPPGCCSWARPTSWTKALLMAAAWVINLAVAEYVIRRRARRSGRTLRPAGRPVRTAREPRDEGQRRRSECLNSTSE